MSPLELPLRPAAQAAARSERSQGRESEGGEEEREDGTRALERRSQSVSSGRHRTTPAGGSPKGTHTLRQSLSYSPHYASGTYHGGFQQQHFQQGLQQEEGSYARSHGALSGSSPGAAGSAPSPSQAPSPRRGESVRSSLTHRALAAQIVGSSRAHSQQGGAGASGTGAGKGRERRASAEEEASAGAKLGAEGGGNRGSPELAGSVGGGKGLLWRQAKTEPGSTDRPRELGGGFERGGFSSLERLSPGPEDSPDAMVASASEGRRRLAPGQLSHAKLSLERPSCGEPRPRSPISPNFLSPGASTPTGLTPTALTPTKLTPTSLSPTTRTPNSRSPTTRTPTSRSPTTRTPTLCSPSTLTPVSRSPTMLTPTSRSPTMLTPTSRSPTSASQPGVPFKMCGQSGDLIPAGADGLVHGRSGALIRRRPSHGEDLSTRGQGQGPSGRATGTATPSAPAVGMPPGASRCTPEIPAAVGEPSKAGPRRKPILVPSLSRGKGQGLGSVRRLVHRSASEGVQRSSGSGMARDESEGGAFLRLGLGSREGESGAVPILGPLGSESGKGGVPEAGLRGSERQEGSIPESQLRGGDGDCEEESVGDGEHPSTRVMCIPSTLSWWQAGESKGGPVAGPELRAPALATRGTLAVHQARRTRSERGPRQERAGDEREESALWETLQARGKQRPPQQQRRKKKEERAQPDQPLLRADAGLGPAAEPEAEQAPESEVEQALGVGPEPAFEPKPEPGSTAEESNEKTASEGEPGSAGVMLSCSDAMLVRLLLSGDRSVLQGVPEVHHLAVDPSELPCKHKLKPRPSRPLLAHARAAHGTLIGAPSRWRGY